MRKLQNHSLYRHYKGKLYYVIGEAREVTDGNYQEVIVYQALYGDNELFVRNKEEFLSLAPQNAANMNSQKYRFEHIKGENENGI